MDDDRPLHADQSGPADDALDGVPKDGEHNAAAPQPSWSNLWQVPTIFLSMVLIVMAVRVAMNRAPADDFAGVLDQVEQLMVEGQLNEAGVLLREVLEPNIAKADDPHKARFHAAIADWTSLVQREERVDSSANNTRIDRHYTTAVELQLALDAPRLERWADALISLNRIHEARQRLIELDALDAGLTPIAEVRRRRIALFQRLVQRAVTSTEIPAELVHAWLHEYRTDRRTSSAEKLWAIARQAELRLDAGDARQAIDQLLVDIRRVEYAAEPGERLDMAELYTLLGRGYHALGEDVQAERYLNQALAELERTNRTTDPVRADALVISGRIAVANGDHDLAYEMFDTVLRDFLDTRSYLPALMGRAEVSSILGSHGEAQADYRQLAELIGRSRPADERVANRGVGRSLVDRHDACIALGQLELAVEYAMIAERLFPAAEVPTDVLYRIASTSRQLGENLLADAGGVEQAELDVRHQSNLMYERAAAYYVQHARAVTGLPNSDDRWAESLWNAADCFDLAGLHEQAIAHFEEYLAGRSQVDPRRGDVSFRLAQAHHAVLQYESAALFYEQVIKEHPRSINATRSHVPLARCYMALGRRPEAEQQLRQVLAGMHAVQPEAMDFRDAMIELGSMYYDTGRYIAAIEQLDEAAKRYPDDKRHLTVLFRLADSYRNHAMQLDEEIREPSAKSPGERRRIDDIRREHLTTALELFSRICVLYDQQADALTALQADLLRAAYIHRADCAYHLGMHERAIVLYDEAARRYSEHHSSLHALIQIVNCYSELGDEARAAAAHRRALVRLRQMRDDAFDAPDALMDRHAWERWLENTPIAPTQSAGAAASAAES